MTNKNIIKRIMNDSSKYFYHDKCLWSECNSKAINSHSHTEKILRIISNANHVFGLTKNSLMMHEGKFFQKYGVNGASIFNGFCSFHDNDLFKKIENTDLDHIDHELAFLLFTRSAYFEHYQKLSSIIRLRKQFELMDKYNYPYDKTVAELGIKAYQQNVDVFPQYQHRINQIYKNSNYEEVIFLHKIINKKIPISLSTNINPLFQKHEITEKVAQPFFSLNIIPYTNHALIVIAWLKEYGSYMSWIKDRFENDLNKLLNYLCFIESEDFFLQPSFYDKKIKLQKEFFSKAFFNRASFPDFGFDDTVIFFNFL